MRGMRFANIRPPGWLPVFGLMLFAAWLPLCAAAAEDAAERRFLYVAEPGIRNDLQYGGHGGLGFDIADGHKFVRQVGPFSGVVRPFTFNGRQTLAYACVNELLGFEIGDLKSGQVLARVEVQGFAKGPVARHGCPSHGIGLTADEKEVWVCDAANRRMHVFDAAATQPRRVAAAGREHRPARGARLGHVQH